MQKKPKGKIYIFDTNMIVSNEEKLDSRLLSLRPDNKNFYITTSTQSEISRHLEKGFNRNLKSKLKILDFEDLRTIHPDICPIYYFFISCMHNPATVGDLSFFSENMISYILNDKDNRNKKIWKKLNMMSSDNIKTYFKKYQYEKTSNDNDELFELLKENNLNYLKKKRSGIVSDKQNLLNDSRSLSISLINCLKNSQNTTFVTADLDHVFNLMNVCTGVAQNFNFVIESLKHLEKNNLKDGFIKNKTTINFTLNSTDFLKQTKEYINSIYSDKKNDYISFLLKYWNIEKQKYLSMEIKFDKDVKEIFLGSHGQLHCFGKNNDMGKWLAYKFEWPPSDLNNYENDYNLKVEIRTKNLVLTSDKLITRNLHENICRYRKEDMNNDFSAFSQFIVPDVIE